MEFKEIIDKYDWSDKFEKTLSKHYPDQKIDNYKTIYNLLKTLKPKKSKYTIILEECNEFNDVWINIYGIIKDDECSYGIEFESWEKWLGMKIHIDSLIKFDNVNIIIHCLYEMTYFGFDQKTIKKEKKKLKKISKEFETMSQEEKEIYFKETKKIFKNLWNM